ncbi:hypothetical protein M2152_002071 [Microbacteriaceae bacterium SG_E_30_P1]|uniref:DUF559 domain-containing protein n=1 Tax=Antiquaquibacter oligotrophicus TaxID=2880260 RepID=A0ABT6KPG7_9MICO|nr:hypothetical protein [Antiquaquibacter oligotrophicus]MDH6181889.1 hypothetical protein [Antiquaquibacter oligotrophicus]UDF12438.1 hypothetical protein LH407_09740 [Antiquaquibacter oligotrophicus]
MSRRIPLPPELAARAFSVREGSAVVGSLQRLRASDLDRSVWGTRFVGEPTFVDRCMQFQERMPGDSFFSHDTAALLWGTPLPPRPRPFVHISVPEPARAPHAKGIIGHRALVADELTVHQGLPLTTPVRTWLDLWELSLPDLVAAGDFVIFHERPLATRPGLDWALRHRVSRRGLRTLWRALHLLSDRAESPPESILRVLLLEAGFPPISVNEAIYDRRDRFIARPDLRVDQLRLVIEYLGDYHRDKQQWRSDITRRTRIEAEGWRVFEVGADDLREPHDLVRRIRAVAALPFPP